MRLFSPSQPPEVRRFIHSLIFPLFLALVMFTLRLIETLEGVSLVSWGIYPREMGHWWRLLTAPLVHGDWSHLGSNLTSFVALTTTLLYFYRGIAYRVFLLIYLFTNVLLWCIGRESWHVGASGVIYGLATFLFFSGAIRHYIPLMAISLIVVFLYGSMIWGIFPLSLHLPYSWEAHLSGTVSGIALSIVFRKKGPQKPPPKAWEEESDDDNEEPYWQQSQDDK